MLALIEKKTRNVICEFNSDHIIQAESIQEMTEKVIYWKQCMFLISSLCFILGMNGIKNRSLPNVVFNDLEIDAPLTGRIQWMGDKIVLSFFF